MPSSGQKPASPIVLMRAITVLAGLGLVLALSAAATGLLAGLGHRWGWWPFHTGFALLRWSVYAGGLAAAVAGLSLLPAIVTRQWRSLGMAAVAVVCGLVVLAIPWRYLDRAREAPAIHDITTDTEHPPAFQAVLKARRGSPNGAAYEGTRVAALQREGYPGIRPAHFALPPAKVFPAVEAVARRMDWRIQAANPQAGRLEATARTFWFGFRDDVVVRLTPDDGGTRVDVRSASRVGLSDLGTNARRIRAFLEALRAAVPHDGQ